MSVVQFSTKTIEPSADGDRARAYAALLGMVVFEVDEPTLGACVERWARFMTGTDLSEQALLATLRLYRDRCPLISLVRACAILNLNLRDVLAEEMAA